MHRSARHIIDTQSGFSLLETLFALVIMSFASMALFQSTSAMLSLSDRAVGAAERSLDRALDRRALGGVLQSLVPHWPEQAGTAFTGSPTRLRGVSSAALSETPGLNGFVVALERDNARLGQMQLRYQNQTEGDAPLWTLMGGLPNDARFSYLGLDNQWYQNWPPEQTPVTPYFNDARFIEPPALPLAIKLDSGASGTLFMIDLSAHPQRPIRLDLGRDTL
ncbi:type II secretion system protein J [Fretibacter rubidus]|uniref:PulJ/GspJ family protein n=1 Tax=Fretibacter rubidus TaxID=570162 RepID=UPI00352AEDA7